MALVEFEHVEKILWRLPCTRDINLRFEKDVVVPLDRLGNPLLSVPSTV